ncbi:MAG: hypothetical protein AAGH40_12025, partial [Verrucomicrobiota bacterium]
MSASAVLVFIPSCSGLMFLIDAYRFGYFQYESYTEVADDHVYLFLPPGSKKISIEKSAHGHRAKYIISESELRAFLDDLWLRDRKS